MRTGLLGLIVQRFQLMTTWLCSWVYVGTRHQDAELGGGSAKQLTMVTHKQREKGPEGRFPPSKTLFLQLDQGFSSLYSSLSSYELTSKWIIDEVTALMIESHL